MKITKTIVEAAFHAFHHEHGFEHFINGLLRVNTAWDSHDAQCLHDPIYVPDYRMKTRREYDDFVKQKQRDRAAYVKLGAFLFDLSVWLQEANFEAEPYKESKDANDKA